MDFSTKLWHRSEKSFATTIPQALLFLLDPNKKYNVKWSYDLKNKVWFVDFLESNLKSKEKATFLTSLWKRSQRSFATTVPHPVILQINENKENQLEWKFDSKMQKYTVALKEVKK